MTTYPVFDCDRRDYIKECEPIGQASTEAEALALLQKYFAGTGAEVATVELNDRDIGADQLWAYWPIFA